MPSLVSPGPPPCLEFSGEVNLRFSPAVTEEGRLAQGYSQQGQSTRTLHLYLFCFFLEETLMLKKGDSSSKAE